MIIGGSNLCDFCFKPIPEGSNCPHCGLTHANYTLQPGLLKPGTNLFGKYIIGKTIGRGGFGATYVAYSSKYKKPVAIKEYLPMAIACRDNAGEKVTIISEDKRDIFIKGSERFYKEAQTIYSFGFNPNIVSVYEFFYANNTAYFSMEYLEGCDLKKYIEKRGGRLDEREAIYIFSKVCKALSVVHAKKMLHRDISPDNIFICSNCDVKLIDFGSARQYVSDGTSNFSVIVKRGFAPAEQYVTNGNQGAWTDIYALGASLYYTITGAMPPEALSIIESGIVFDDNIYISDKVKAVISKCMRYRIEERYRDVESLRQDLEDVLTQSIPVSGSGEHGSKIDVAPPIDTPSDESDGGLTYKPDDKPKKHTDILKQFNNVDKTTKYILYAIAGLICCLIIVFSIAIFGGRNHSSDEFSTDGGGGNSQVTTGVTLGQLGAGNNGKTGTGGISDDKKDDPATKPSSGNVERVRKKLDIDQIETIINNHCKYTDFGVYVKNITTGDMYSYHANKSLIASAMSQVVILDVFARAVEEYGIDVAGDCYQFDYIPNGKEAPDSQSENGTLVTVKKCIEDVAEYGDNNKSNLFVDHIGFLYNSENPFDVINDILDDNGYSDTSINRKIMTDPNYVHPSPKLNMTSAYEIAGIFEHLIYCNSLGSPNYMKNIFKSVSLEGEPIGIKKYVPSSYNVSNANGISAQATNNVAIISNDDCEIVVAILAVTRESKTGVETHENRERAVSEIVNYIVENQF